VVSGVEAEQAGDFKRFCENRSEDLSDAMSSIRHKICLDYASGFYGIP
jgi:hypothetical protein